MRTAVRKWVHGLVAAFIGGASTAFEAGLTLIVVAPENFNLGKGLGKLLLTVLVLGVLSGARVAFAYLKQSPVPPDVDEPQQVEIKHHHQAATEGTEGTEVKEKVTL